MDTRTPQQRELSGNERRVIGNRAGSSVEGSFINKCSTSPSSRNDGGCWNDEQDGYVKLPANCSVVWEWHSHASRHCQCDSDGTTHRTDNSATTTIALYPDSRVELKQRCNKQNRIGKLFRGFHKSAVDKAGGISNGEVNENSNANGFLPCDHNKIISPETRLTIGERGERWSGGVFCSICLGSSIHNVCLGCGEVTGLSCGCDNKIFRGTDNFGSDNVGGKIITWNTSVNDGVCDKDKKKGKLCVQNIYSAWPTRKYYDRSEESFGGNSTANNLLGLVEPPKTRKSVLCSEYNASQYVHDKCFGSNNFLSNSETLNKFKNNENTHLDTTNYRDNIDTRNTKCKEDKFKYHRTRIHKKGTFDIQRTASKFSFQETKSSHSSTSCVVINRFRRHPLHYPAFYTNISYRLYWHQRTRRFPRHVESSIPISTTPLNTPASSPSPPSSLPPPYSLTPQTSSSSSSSPSISSASPQPPAALPLNPVKDRSLPRGHSIYWQSVNLSSAAGRSVTSPHFDSHPGLCPLHPNSPSVRPLTMASNRHPPPPSMNTFDPLQLSNTNTPPIRDRTVSSHRSPDNRRCDSGLESHPLIQSPIPPQLQPLSPPTLSPLQNNNTEMEKEKMRLPASLASAAQECENTNRSVKDEDGKLLLTGELSEGGDENKRLAYCVENDQRGGDKEWEGVRGGTEGKEKHLPVHMENKQVGNGKKENDRKDGSEIGRKAEMMRERIIGDEVMEREEEKTDKEKVVMAPCARENLSPTDRVTARVDIVDAKTGCSDGGENQVYSLCTDSLVGISADAGTCVRGKRADRCEVDIKANVCRTSDLNEYCDDVDDSDVIVVNSDYLLPSETINVNGFQSCDNIDNINSSYVLSALSGEIQNSKSKCDNISATTSEYETVSNNSSCAEAQKVINPTGGFGITGNAPLTKEPHVRCKDHLSENNKLCERNSDKNVPELVQHSEESSYNGGNIKNVDNSDVEKDGINSSLTSRKKGRDDHVDKTVTNNENGKTSGSVKENRTFEYGVQLRVEIEDKQKSGRLPNVYANYSNCKNTDIDQTNSDDQWDNTVCCAQAQKDNIIGDPLPDRSFLPCNVRKHQRPRSVHRDNPPPSHRLSHQYLNSNCCLSGTPFVEFTHRQSPGMIFTSSPTTSNPTYIIDKSQGQEITFKNMPLNTNNGNCGEEDSKLLLTPKRQPTPIIKNMGSITGTSASMLTKTHHYYNYNNDLVRPVIVSSMNVPPSKMNGRGMNSNHPDDPNTNSEREYLCDMSSCCSMYDPSMDSGVRKPLPIKSAFQSQASPVVFQHNPSHKLGPYYNQNQHSACCDHCQSCAQPSNQSLCHSPNFVPYQQQHHHFYQLQKQQQHLHQQKQHQHQHLQQKLPQHPHHTFTINNPDWWITELNFILLKHKFNFTPISLLWTLFSLLISASCLMSFLTPYWMTHPDHAHSFGLINLCIANPQYARNRPLCFRYGDQYFKYTHPIYPYHADTVNNIIITGNNQTFFERLQKVGSASFEEIPSRAWRTACLMFGTGCVLELIGSLTTVVSLLALSGQHSWRTKVTRINGYLQAVAVMFLFLAILIFPAGFDSPTYSHYCQSSGHSYNSGHCSMGWSYIMAVMTFALSIFCPVLAWLGLPPGLKHEALTPYKEYA